MNSMYSDANDDPANVVFEAGFDQVFSSYVDSILAVAEQEYGLDIVHLKNKFSLRDNGHAINGSSSGGSSSQAFQSFHVATVYLLVMEIVNLTGDQSIGLKIGRRVSPQSFNILGYLASNCASLRESLNYIIRYEKLALQSSFTQLETSNAALGESRLTWSTPYLGDEAKYFKEAVVCGWVAVTRHVISPEFQAELSLNRVTFQHEKNESFQDYEAFFNCPVEFSAGETAIYFQDTLLDTPLMNSDVQLQQILKQQADLLLQDLDSDRQAVSGIRKVIIQQISDEALSMETVAEIMQVSPRVLHNKLKKHGYTFNKLVAEVKKVLAIYHLREKHVSLVEIAHQLGYSDQSAFNRAFRRWSGESPGDCRRRLF